MASGRNVGFYLSDITLNGVRPHLRKKKKKRRHQSGLSAYPIDTARGRQNFAEVNSPAPTAPATVLTSIIAGVDAVEVELPIYSGM